MSGDLVSLRMMVIAASEPVMGLWRQGAGMAAVPVEFSAEDPASAIAALGRHGADVCVIDDDVPAADKTAVITAARGANPAPLIFISASAGAARPAGIDGVVAKPRDQDEARALAEVCVRAKIPTRVLIVDDSGTMRSIVRKILSASRFTLDMHEAAEGFAALEQLRGGKFGMVFLDYNMPGLNGFETLSEIKRESPNVAVVMMTSTLDNAIADRAHAAGALAFLKKPFYPADIDSVLERYYGLHAAHA
ncbi:MAG TPA: response regulator [Pseudolabrys sp.]|nr:response regulator [Pseudolabrys sp.]